MDKILKCLFVFAVMALSLTGCRDDAELVSPGTPGHPEQEIVGTYSGSWTVEVSGEEPKEYVGTMTFEAGSEAYQTTVTVSCPESNLDLASVANIVKNSAGYRFYNELPGNTFGAAFSGTVTNEGVASINFTVKQKSGKKTMLYTYSFAGRK